MSVIGDSALPRYEFEYDGRTMTTESVAQQAMNTDKEDIRGIDVEGVDGVDPYTVVESLADQARADPDCNVTMIGFEESR